MNRADDEQPEAVSRERHRIAASGLGPAFARQGKRPALQGAVAVEQERKDPVDRHHRGAAALDRLFGPE